MHFSHSVAETFLLALFPPSHVAHSPNPDDGVYFPDTQAVQFVLPDKEVFPAGQEVQ